MEQQIEAARRRFARSLVGRWSTAQGTFDVVMGQRWEIRADGTGRFVDTGPFGHPREETRFAWRQTDDFVFEMRLTERISSERDDELDDEDRAWRAVRYGFVVVETDCAALIGLVGAAPDGTTYGGFMDSMAPLAYTCPVNVCGEARRL